MPGDPLKLEVHTDSEQEPPAGFDSVIALFPESYYVTVGGKRALIARKAVAWVRALSLKCARDIGEVLHHAEWTITSDPELVHTLGLMHDCVERRDGVERAVAHLRDHPEAEIAVGQLLWARQ